MGQLGLVLTLLLLAAAWTADRLVQQGTKRNDTNALERHGIHATLTAPTDNIWHAENALHELLLVPNRAERARMERDLAHAIVTTERLAQNEWVRTTAGARTRVQQRHDDLTALQNHTSRLVPARMLPAQNGFNTAATLAMDDVLDDGVRRDHAEISRAFVAARHNSTQMVGSF